MRTYVIELHDRPGALERLLNKCRRKNLGIETLRLGPSENGLRTVVVVLDSGAPPAERVVPNLERLYDVASVTVAVDAVLVPSELQGSHAA